MAELDGEGLRRIIAEELSVDRKARTEDLRRLDAERIGADAARSAARDRSFISALRSPATAIGQVAGNPAPLVRWLGSLVTIPRIVTIFLIALFLRPDFYQWVVRTAEPQYYYQIATLMKPPDFVRYAPTVDVHGLDSSPRMYLLRNALNLGGDVARIKEGAYIPGRSDASGASGEGYGKSWTGKQCLFIKDVRLVVLDIRNDAFDKGSHPSQRLMAVPMKYVIPKDPDREILDITSDRLAGTLDQRAAQYKRRLNAVLNRHRDVSGDKCDANLNDLTPPYCPRIAVWARGATAPCTIWPF